MGCLSLLLTPPWRDNRLLLVRAADAIRLCGEGDHEQLPWHESSVSVDALAGRDMLGIREFVSQAGLTSFPLTMFDDHAVLSLLRDSLKNRELAVLRASDGGHVGESSASHEQRSLVKEIEVKAGHALTYSGRRYRLLPDAGFGVLADRTSYEVVPHDDAVAVLRAIAAQSGGPSGLGPLLHEAISKLTADWLPPSSPDGLVLLRRNKAVTTTHVDAGAAITPSQMKQMLQPSAAIEIELVDKEGRPVPGEAWELTLPDGTKRSGQLDGDGYAKVAPIPEGTCQVTFPRLDADAWGPAA